ncbi:uncharacterized protein [Solanum tuberosum]|nr:PREDICTED: uncharacterized protein LOC102583023 isoform X1 [Solanum tuberosum]
MYGRPPYNGGGWHGAQPPFNGWPRAEPPYNGGGSSWRGAEPPLYGRGSGWNGAAPPPPPPLGYQSPHVNHHPQSPNLFHPSNNPNFPVQNPNFRGFPVQTKPRFQFQRPPPPPPPPQAKSSSNSGEIVLKVDRAVKKARRDLVEAGETVSTWKVSQAALAIVKADSWESLGVKMQNVPSLHSLILIEGKIVAFIHCFVAVLRVTTLYDLEVAICKNEGIEQFEKLELGPLLKHPLIIHYFSVNPGVSEVFKITHEEIMSFLSEFMDGNGSTVMKVDELLNFIAEKKSAGSREKLGVRIQSLGMHITFIQQARLFETSAKNKYMHTVKKEPSKIIRKRPILSAQKKQLDKNFISISSDSEDTSSDSDQDETENTKSSEEPHISPYPSASVEMKPYGLKAEVEELDENFTSISERITSFSSANGEFCGKHIRFISSDSEDANSDGDQDETGNIKNSEQPSICPYLNASEEMMPLGLETEVKVSLHTTSGSDIYSKDISQSDSTFRSLLDKTERYLRQSKRKRKFDDIQSLMASHTEVVKRKVVQTKPFTRRKGTKISPLGNQDSNGSSDSSQGNDSIKMFVNTWKEACRTNDVDEVFERMLQFYKVKKKAKVTTLFSSFPFCGLLQVAVTSIQHGMWDSLYDKLQMFKQFELTSTGAENCVNSICIEVESPERGATNHSDRLLVCESGFTVGDIIGKISTYFEGGDDAWSTASSHHEKFFFLLNKFCKLESWLTEQFSVKQFESLGYGDIWSFLEKNMHLFSHTLPSCLTGDMHEKPSLVPSMLDYQFDLLLSQASQCLWETEEVGKRRISELLMRQFPLVCLKVAGSDLMMGVEGFMKINKGDMTLKSVVFSGTLLKEDAVGRFHKNMLEKMGLENGEGNGARIVMSKEAKKVLLKSPMLIDLNLWSHWDVVFAPSLGSLAGWLLNEVSTKELLYLVTACGKVVRVDHSATVDSFLNVLLQGNPFDTAVKLLSLLVLYGGEKNVPFSLLKCHARHAFEVLIEHYEETKSQDPLKDTKFMSRQVINDRSTFTINSKVPRSDRVDSAMSFVSRFVLDCLGYLPVEFYCFAADILLAGLQPFVKDAPSAILGECECVEQRLMLHRVGMLLGIMDWVDDKQKLASSSASSLLMSSGSSCLGVTELDLSEDSTVMHVVSNKYPLSRSGISLSPDPMRQDENQEACCSAVVTNVHLDNLAGYAKMHSCELECSAARVIESIQQEEFGLQPDQSLVESALLKKQHARLGRALHCLSQELYSEDSHFILELVQNADDNTYPETVEPSLTFILQDKGIVVLNNERGFSADDIRALCDVGNSTKKGRNAGYIGKKGIGFKSVFRVTDAPEIHSNGFHIKFDITNGQIGFVLPTVVPPCDIDFYTRLASTDPDCNHWKTCIVLPLRSSLLERSSGKNIISMFADLHPSLLLFLHRLHCIKFRNMLSDSIIVMRKEVVGNGIVNVSYGEEKMTCYVVSQKLQADTIRPDTPTTEISIAFTLQETADGSYNPHLDQQHVFSFLPLRKYGLKFILQGDFVLPSSREGVDGDSPWNQWLLSEFPSLFVSAERSFCDLPCFRDNPAKGVTAYMSFIPLVGDVHGFFCSLPRMILSRLRTSNCLLLEGTENEWVAPCRVLSNWTEESRKLLPDSLLRKHLGLGFLHKDIILPDLLARVLGIEKYGLKVLFQVMTSLCSSEDGLKSMGLGWLCVWLNTVYNLLSNSESSAGFRTATDLMNDLRKIPFIPLSDGKYGSLDEGVIWLHLDPLGSTIDDKYAAETFPGLYASLRTVSSALLSAAAALGTSHCESSILDNVTRILYRAGVEPLSAHQIAKKHIVPSLYREQNGQSHREIMTEDLAFFMLHLQSNCPDCQSEKEQIIREVRDSAFCQCDSCICQCPELHSNSLFLAFLPLRKYGLKYKLQGDFVVPSSGDEVADDIAWNQWLLSEFPGLFASTERLFCDLSCFRNNPAKGVTAYMSFVPVVGEDHGFFSSLPRMILSRLRMSNCLILEGTENEWVAPCKVLRNWTEEFRNLLPDSLLQKHLGVGFLHKDIVLSDLLARALGIVEYGLKALIQVITSLCSSEDGLKLMGLGWISAWLNTIYTLLSNGKDSADFETESDLMKDLQKIPFIPLSDGNYGSLDEGAIWLQFDSMGYMIDGDYVPETFPRLHASLRIVSPALLSAAATLGTSNRESSEVDNVIKMLYRAGVQRLSTHQIVKKHILPSLYSEKNGERYRDLMTEYVAFLMFHWQSSCPDCQLEKEQIINEVRVSAFCQCDSCVCQCPELHSNSLYFAFFPLRKYGLKYKLQGDFVLPSSKEADGDNAWNQWLLSEFPGLFVSTEGSFCNMPCFRDNPAKGVTVYMSFVPLVGEGHGFFSSLPQMILSRLRMSNCLIVEGAGTEWIAPCKVLRNWTEESRKLLPDSLLRKHLGVGFMHKDIILPDLLARALGVEEYGLKVLFQVITSLCSSKDGLRSMGLGWLSAFLNTVYTLLSDGKDLAGFGTESGLMRDLKKIPFIPLSDGKYGSLDEGAIWLHFHSLGATINDVYAPETFPRLYASVRTVSSALLSTAAALGTSCCGSSVVDNVSMMLYRVGVQRLSAHQIVKIHILPYLYREQNEQGHKEIMTEYLAFLMIHLQSSCCDCQSEKEQIIRELRDNVFILTNHGCRRPGEVPIHFSKEYGNPIDMSRLIQGLDLTWHEIEDTYLKHPVNRMLSGSVLKWRKFFQEMGISDFVQVLQVEKSMSDVCPLPMNVTWHKDLIPVGSIAKDWMSEEFVNMLLLLSSTHDTGKCNYLLEVLDRLWDDYFSDKVTGFYFTSNGERKIFDSSFSRILCDVRWIASSLDNELHCPRELFHDCEAVRSIFGGNAPYTVPKVRSERLLTALGLKTQVTADDTLSILKVWRAKAPLRASVSQMSRFYTFMWNTMNTSERKVVEELRDAPCVFIPLKFGASLEDAVPGVLLSLKEVFWCDSTGSVDQVKMVNTKFVQQHPVTRILCSLYPGLHDFFVNRCGVDEFPHFHGYLQILLHLSAVALPLQEAKKVFHIFLKWADELKSGSLRFEDVDFLEKSLKEKQYLILPTAKNKWVSLNQSFGLICWCDDDKLRTEFEHFDNINFLYFGELNDENKEILRTKVSIFMRRVNIPSLSEVVTREIIYDDPTDTCFIASMVNWALPYAQRYMYNNYTDKYLQLSQSVFENLRCLQIVVVEKLFYRNVIRSVHIESEKQFECNCLLEGNILYATRGSDSHSIFMEISRLFYSRAPDLHLANFLHMITTMAKSGSTEEQIEFFILNSQKMPKLPVGESVWSLSNIPLSTDSVTWLMTSCASKTISETNTVNSKNKPGGNSYCSTRKTDHGGHDSRASVMKTQAASSIQPRKEETSKEVIEETSTQVPTQITCVSNDPAACADWKTEHSFHGSCASVMRTHADSYIQPRREETIEEVIEETSVLVPTQITCVHSDPVPADRKTGHGFYGSHASFMKTQASNDIQPRKEETVEGVMAETSALAPTEITCGRNDPAPTVDRKTDHGFRGSVMKTQAASGIQPRKPASTEITRGRNNPASGATLLGSRDTDHVCNRVVSSTINASSSSAYNVTIPQDLNYSSFDMRERGQPSVGMGYPQQASLTGRFSSHVHNVLVPSTVNAAINNVTAPQDLNYNSFDARERVQMSSGMVYPQQPLSTGRFSDHVHNVLVPSTVNAAFTNVTAPQDLNYNSFDARERVQLSFGMVDPQQALFTGRLGESAAFNYFVGKLGKPFVKWVNETNETGLPYDLLVAGNEYIEVKATRSVTKDWFHITLREWQFALEKGELFSIAHVVLSPHNAATVTVYKNPARLCCLGKLQLALIIPK